MPAALSTQVSMEMEPSAPAVTAITAHQPDQLLTASGMEW